MNESEAKAKGIEYRVTRLPAAGVLRTLTLSETRGFLKMLIDEHSDRILGFTAFIAGAGELIAVAQTAMINGAPFTSLRDAIFAHPTLAEAFSDSPMLEEIEIRESDRVERDQVPVP